MLGFAKYLEGEKLGTTRAAPVNLAVASRHAHETASAHFAVLNSRHLSPCRRKRSALLTLSYSFAATGAWYHKKLAPELTTGLQEDTGEAEQFAEGNTPWTTNGPKLRIEKAGDRREKCPVHGGSQPIMCSIQLRSKVSASCASYYGTMARWSVAIRQQDHGEDASAAESPDSIPLGCVQGPYTEGGRIRCGQRLKLESDLPYEILRGRAP